MLYHAKNGHINGTDYIRFGTGCRNLVILPGLGDGLQTVKGTALPMAWMYRIFARDFTVYCFSRKTELPQGHSTRDMARDLKEAMGRKILVCVGDGENDVAMLEAADYAFCPADAIVRDRFPNVCPCGEGAVADVIYKKIPEILKNNP